MAEIAEGIPLRHKREVAFRQAAQQYDANVDSLDSLDVLVRHWQRDIDEARDRLIADVERLKTELTDATNIAEEACGANDGTHVCTLAARHFPHDHHCDCKRPYSWPLTQPCEQRIGCGHTYCKITDHQDRCATHDCLWPDEGECPAANHAKRESCNSSYFGNCDNPAHQAEVKAES